MFSINDHDKKKPTHVYDISSGGGRAIPNNKTTSALESLGATLNSIDCWLKFFYHNYEVRKKMYNESTRELFKQIPTMKPKPSIRDKNTS